MTWYVVDGMDGSGKTTVSDYLKEDLTKDGRKVLEITHPNVNSIFGRIASKFLHLDSKVSEIVSTVFYILDVLNSLFLMKRKHKEYDDVIFVRYILAVSYLPEKLTAVGYRVISKVLPMPDVKIYVDVDAKTSMDRILERGEELEIFETEEKLAHTRDKMKKLTEGWIIVDNSGSKETTEKAVSDILRNT